MTDILQTGLTAEKGLRAAARAALGCLLGATLLAASTPAHAQQDGKSLENRIIGGILEGVGLQKDRDPINYGERAPLVIPPSRALPVPERADTATARNPAWPKDPDVARRKAEAVQTRRMTTDEREHEMDRLRPEEMTPGGPGPRQARADDGYRPGPDSISSPMTPSQLGYLGNMFNNPFGKKTDENVSSFTKEPPRTALTDPPSGYQTPSPNQPYGLGKQTTERKVGNYLEEHGVLTSD